MRQNKNAQNGFIPMLIALFIVFAAIVWVAYKHVNDAHKKQLLQKANRYENSISQ